MLDVIIPAYNAHDTIVQTLMSICVQDLKEQLNVYIVNDCSDKDYSEEVEAFSKYINIKELKMKKNSGPGLARQYGIENSSAPFLMFLDADDQFVNPFSVRKLLSVLRKDQYDFVCGVMIEEHPDILYFYPNHQGCLHGKVYRRSFIEEHNVKFRNSRSSEDNGFNNLYRLYSPRTLLLDYNVYLYRDRSNSITKSTELNTDFNYMYHYMDNLCASIEQGIKDDCDRHMIIELAFGSAMYAYRDYCLSNSPKKYLLLEYCKDIVKYVRKYEDVITKDEFLFAYQGYIRDDMILPMTFNEFVDLVEKHNGENND